MRIEKRNTHCVLYLAPDGVQAIRLPPAVDVKHIKALLNVVPPGTHSRRKKAIAILNENGIDAK